MSVLIFSLGILPGFADNGYEPEHLFPLMKNLVKDRPQIPPPYGFSFVSNWIDSDWKFTSATVGINDVNVPAEFAPNCSANIRTSTAGAKVDVWVLPFLNVFATGGYAHSENQLILRGVPVKFVPPGIGRPADVVRGDVAADFDLNGPIYTFGMVIAGGYRKFFSSADFSASKIDFGHTNQVSGDQSWTYSVAPRAGYAVGLTQFWLGARYINYSTHYVGTFPIPSGQNFSFNVDVKTATWNTTAGIRTVLLKHWEILMETGFGARHMMTGSIGYRW